MALGICKRRVRFDQNIVTPTHPPGPRRMADPFQVPLRSSSVRLAGVSRMQGSPSTAASSPMFVFPEPRAIWRRYILAVRALVCEAKVVNELSETPCSYIHTILKQGFTVEKRKQLQPEENYHLVTCMVIGAITERTRWIVPNVLPSL